LEEKRAASPQQFAHSHGCTIKDTAAQPGIGYYTTDKYIRSVHEGLQVRSRGSAIAKAVQERLM